VAAGAEHSLGLKESGSLVAWGSNERGQCTVPTLNSGFVAVAAGAFHSLALRDDGTMVAPRPRPDVGDRPRSPHILGLAPNPFNPTLWIVYELTESSAVRLEIFDLRGRRLFSQPLGVQGRGRREARWDGRDTMGGVLPSGLYLARLWTPQGASPAAKCLLVR
jgi:hypothetical protein